MRWFDKYPRLVKMVQGIDAPKPKTKNEEYNNSVHKQKRDNFGGTSLCDPLWIPFAMAWEWSRVTCKVCLDIRKGVAK